MPLSPDVAWDLAEPVVDVYAEAERRLLERIGRSLAAGLDAPGWAETKLLEVQLLQRHTAADLIASTVVAQAHGTVGVQKAWNRGVAAAERDVARTVLGGLRRASTLQPTLDRIMGELTSSLQAVTQRVLRAVPDVYRDVIRATAPQAIIGLQTRRQAAQAALNELADRGVTGFTDKAGRQWQLDSYVEMATRAATGRAAVDGHTDRLAARGFDLVHISDAPQECHLCRPWEGKVLTTGPKVAAPAVATLDQARAAGLFHPGCRHSTGIYLPGITNLPTDTADPQGDADRQRLRALERRVRAAKRREAVALDPAARTAARRQVRAGQAEIREHVATTSAKRQPHREQLRRPQPVTRDPFARDTDEQLQGRLMAEFEKGAPDEALVERISVQMEMRERYAGTDLSEHYRRRNTVLDEGFAGQSDEEIGQLVEQAIASGDPEAGAFVSEAQLELEQRAYSGKGFHRAVVQAARPRAESKAAKLRSARADYDLFVEQQRRDLEEATNGNLIRHDREAEYRKKHGGSELAFILTADPQTMYRYASEEVRRHFAANPGSRMTFAEFAVQAGIDDPALVERAERARRKALDAATRAEEREKPRRRR